MILSITLALALFVLLCLRFAWWKKPINYSTPRILMYHMVREHIDGAKFNKLRVPLKQFERQIEWLAKNNWHFITMSELAAANNLPDKSVALTFDDGYLDNYTNAHTILKRFNARATLYLVADRFDRDWSSSKKSHHNSGELMHEQKLSDQQVKEMLQSGHWELGAHTITHAYLPKLSVEEKREEICGSRTLLQEKFGTPVSSFAYPFGFYAAEDVEIARQCGFLSAVTTETGMSMNLKEEMLELKRVKISGKDSLFEFALKMKIGKRGLFG